MVRIRLRLAAVVAAALLTGGCGALTSGVSTAPAFPSDLPSLAPTGQPSRAAPAHPPAPSPTALSAAALRAAPNIPGPWRLVFDDDFNESQLDPDKWVTCYDWNDDGCTNAGHRELEWYLPGQVSLSDGALVLTARKQPTYGYIAAAIQIPAQGGMFPSFWLMPAGSRTTPPEIDIMEAIEFTDRAQMTLHWTDPVTGKDTFSAVQYGPVDYPAGYHVFAVDWEPKSITWYIDGVARYRVTDTARIPKVPMEMLLDLAVGSPKDPPADVRSAQMKVDWVRAWQH